MTDIQQEVGMCVRCWGKAFTAAYGIGSKTQAGEYERIVAGCECTPWQRLGVANGFAEGYEARLAEDAKREALWRKLLNHLDEQVIDKLDADGSCSLCKELRAALGLKEIK